jgi:hypothetical protein
MGLAGRAVLVVAVAVDCMHGQAERVGWAATGAIAATRTA